MSDERKTQAQLEAELARLSREAADLRAALAAEKASRPVEGMPGDYDLLFETLAEALMVVRVRDGLILRANPCCRRLLGLAEGDLAGKTFYHFMPEAARPRAEAILREAAAGSRLILQHETVYGRPDGTNVAIEVGGAILGDAPDTAALLYLMDITKNVDAQRLLRETEQRYRLVVDSAGDPIFMLNRQAQFTAVNPVAARAFHCRPEDLVGKTMQEMFPPEVAERQWQQVKKVFDTGEPLFSEENESQTGEGPRWYNTSLTPIRNEGGEVQFVLGIARDVTDRKRAEAALRESEAELRSVQDAMVDGLVIADIQTLRILRVNPAVCRMFGYDRAEFEEMSVTALHTPEEREGVVRRFHERQRGVFGLIGEIRCCRKDGTIFIAELSASPIMIGVRHCTIGVFRDITERKKAEDALHASRQELQAVQDTMGDGILIADAETRRFVRANPAICRTLGYAQDELLTKSVEDIHPCDRLNEALRLFEATVRREIPFASDVPCMRKDGSVFYAEISASRITLDGRSCVLGVFRDITERRRAEAALRQSEENYRLLFESNMNGIAIIGPDGRIVRANNAYCDIHRFPPEKITGMAPLEFIAPQHRGELSRKHEAMFRGEIAAYSGNFRIVRGDGTPGWVEVRSGQMTWEGRPARLAIVQDTTERVQLENELREAQKMEAVGQLAGGIAHDFNNLLTGILCNTQLIRTTPGIPKDVYETADVIEKAARRAAELTGQLLGFARRGKHQDVPVDLEATVRSVIRLLGGAVDPRIAVETALPPEPLWIHGDPTQMEQVVLNLAMNARDSMPGGGRLTFAAETADLDAPACVGRPRAKPGRYVVLRVGDTGCGIPDEIRDRIFDPFFTTKPVGKGTGMGLAMVYGIARSHGGWVEVDSVVGQGSAFRVYLPAFAGPVPQSPADPDGGAAKKGRRTRSATAGRAASKRRPGGATAPCILVVDDDEMVRKTLTRMLAGQGYSVVTAADGRDAVATYGMFGSGVDVVIIDMAMPDMDGRECFQALHRLDPHVRAILCTGGPADEGAREMVGKGMVDFAQKPYQLEQLEAAIAKALARRRGEAPEAPPGSHRA